MASIEFGGEVCANVWTGVQKKGREKTRREIPLCANLSRLGKPLISSREAQVGTDFGDVELKGYFLADGDVWRGEWLRNDEIRAFAEGGAQGANVAGGAEHYDGCLGLVHGKIQREPIYGRICGRGRGRTWGPRGCRRCGWGQRS